MSVRFSVLGLGLHLLGRAEELVALLAEHVFRTVHQLERELLVLLPVVPRRSRIDGRYLFGVIITLRHVTALGVAAEVVYDPANLQLAALDKAVTFSTHICLLPVDRGARTSGCELRRLGTLVNRCIRPENIPMLLV